MRQIFVSKSSIDTQTKQAILIDDSFHHLIHVLRKKRGQWVEAFDGEGGTYRAQILEILPDKAVLAVGERRVPTHPEKFQLTLGIAILKGKKMNWVVQKVTELGISTLVPLITRRTVSRSADHAPAKVAKWEQVAIEAAKQCGRAFVPNIHHPIQWDDFLGQTNDYDVKLLAWEGHSAEAAGGLKACIAQWAQSQENSGRTPAVLLIVGPEGGFDPKEVQQAKDQGCVSFGLGKNILRSETAALIAAAIVSYELGNVLG